jgi:hypothetical protein
LSHCEIGGCVEVVRLSRCECKRRKAWGWYRRIYFDAVGTISTYTRNKAAFSMTLPRFCLTLLTPMVEFGCSRPSCSYYHASHYAHLHKLNSNHVR